MKKIIALAVMAFILAPVGFETLSASAESILSEETVPAVAMSLENGISPYASTIVQKNSYSTTKSLCSAKLPF